MCTPASVPTSSAASQTYRKPNAARRKEGRPRNNCFIRCHLFHCVQCSIRGIGHVTKFPVPIKTSTSILQSHGLFTGVCPHTQTKATGACVSASRAQHWDSACSTRWDSKGRPERTCAGSRPSTHVGHFTKPSPDQTPLGVRAAPGGGGSSKPCGLTPPS